MHRRQQTPLPEWLKQHVRRKITDGAIDGDGDYGGDFHSGADANPKPFLRSETYQWIIWLSSMLIRQNLLNGVSARLSANNLGKSERSRADISGAKN